MKRYSRLIGATALALVLMAALATSTQAHENTSPHRAIPNTQENELRLSLHKQFGYAMGGEIQGTFKVSAQGPSDLVSVTFALRDEAGKLGSVVLGQVTQAPFALTFNTDKYPHGRYELNAVGQTAGGQRIESNVLRAEFVSAEAGWQSVGKIIIPIFVLIAVAMLLSSVVPMLFDRGGKKGLADDQPLGEPRNYGLLGGAVCPKCGRPFGLHLWAFRISFMGRFDHCPNCGKWSFVRRASQEELAAAEAAELGAAAPSVPQPSPEEKRRKQIQDSRYF